VISVCYALGLTEASVGIHSALERAAQCEADPGFRIQAWRIRMTYYLVQGDWVQAESCRKTEERLRIQHGGAQDLEGSHLQSLLIAYTRADDLMGVKQTMDATGAMAKRFEGWAPVFARARAEYHRLRGDSAQALVEYDRALSMMVPARHAGWYTTIEGQVGVLLDVGRADEARIVALHAIEVCEARESMLAKHAISRALSLVEARLGDFPRAIARIEAVLAGAYESRARIAIEMDDRAAFETFAAKVAEVYDRGRSAALKAKYARLMDDACQSGVEQSPVVADIRATMRTTMTRTETVANTMHTALERCRGSSERADELLKLVLKQMRLERGALYTVQVNGMTLSAARAELPSGLDALVERFVKEQMQSSEEQTEAVEGAASDGQSATGLLFRHGDVVYRPLLLSSYREDRDWVTGVIVVCEAPDATVLVPHDTLRAASDALIDAGDVVSQGF
jgi:tetratricopeptide (TPR) repeat protein